MFTWAFNPPIQNLLLELGGGLLISLNASAIYLGAGLSAVVGGLVIQLVGITYLPLIAAVLDVAVLGLLVTLRRDPALQRVEHLDEEEAEVLAVVAD
jgi:predicted MFS family arabinose efflux permease